MAIQAQQGVPTSIRVGDTSKFALNYADFPADEWDLTFFVGGKSAEAVADGTLHVVTLAASETKGLLPGNQPFLARVTNGDGEVQTAESGIVQVLASIAEKSEQTWAAKTLAACEAAITKIAGGTNERVNINGQEFTKRNLKDLLDFRDRLRREVDNEKVAAGGQRTSRNIRVRFI